MLWMPLMSNHDQADEVYEAGRAHRVEKAGRADRVEKANRNLIPVAHRLAIFTGGTGAM
jgi:hypothetical protein